MNPGGPPGAIQVVKIDAHPTEIKVGLRGAAINDIPAEFRDERVPRPTPSPKVPLLTL